MRMFMACIVIIFISTKTASSETDLQQQNQNDYLNPVNDYDQGSSAKNQDKRTILSPHHGWAKHVGVHPSGFKYIIGYGPVDLKYVPVVKPISIRPLHHHHHHRLKLHLRYPVVVKPLLPVRPVVHHDGWRPVVPLVKPVVPIVKPVAPIVRPVPVPVNVPAPPYIPHQTWQQEGWTSAKPVHVHPVTVVKPVVPIKPVVPVQPVVPARPIHHVPVKPVQIIPSKPLIPVAQPVAPLVPFPPHFKPLHPGILGPAFVHQVPLVPPGVPLHADILAQINPGLFHHHHHHLVPANQLPVAAPAPPVFIQHTPPVVVPQAPPQTIVPAHLHTTHIHPQVPHLHVHPQVPHQHVHPQVPHLHVHPQDPHVHVHPQVPHEQHDVQTPLIPQDHPIFTQQLPHQHPHIYQPHLHAQHPEIFQQQLPHEHFAVQHPEVLQQQLPHDQQVPFHLVHQQLPHDPNAVFHQHPQPVPVDPQLPQNAPTLFHQHLPDGNVQHHFNQQIQHGDSATSNIILQGSIQPGHTDVQIPAHLPQHPNYLPEEGRQFHPGNFHDPSQHPDVVRPSIALEPPFTHKK